MTDFDQKTIIVTGASKGIGAATARHLAARGATVGLRFWRGLSTRWRRNRVAPRQTHAENRTPGDAAGRLCRISAEVGASSVPLL